MSDQYAILTDDGLVKAILDAKRQDSNYNDAWQTLFARKRSLVARNAKTIMADYIQKSESEQISVDDAVQLSFIKMLNSLELYRGGDKFNAFIWSITRSCTVDLVRKYVSKRKGERAYTEINTAAFTPQNAEITPYKTVEQWDELAQVKIALRMHSESGNTPIARKKNQRSCQVLELYADDIVQAEIAERVGLSTRQVIREMKHDLEEVGKILRR